VRKAIAAGASALALVFFILLPAGLFSVPAWGADTDAPCCDDLEQRVAELEATTARGGNGRLSFRIYGQINRALLMWKDGFDSNAHVVDNATSSSRFGFAGQAEIRPGLIAGYRLEVEAPFPSSEDVFNGLGGSTAVLGTDTLRIRQSYWDLASRDLGRVAVGFQSPATDDITIINLGSQMNDAALHYNNAFRIRLDLASPPITTDLRWGQIAHTVDSTRGNFVRYDTPILNGFLLSTAWNDEVWDVAARYQQQSASFRFATGVGYMRDAEREFEDIKGSASLIHDPTGLYASIAGGLRNDKHSVLSTDDQAYFYYAQLGISKQWLTYGKTTLYADHGVYKDFNVGELLSVVDGQVVAWGTLTDTEVRRWGFGVEQAFDSAGLLVYAQAHFYDPTIVGFPCGPAPFPAKGCGGDAKNTTKLPAEPWQGFVVGARVQF